MAHLDAPNREPPFESLPQIAEQKPEIQTEPRKDRPASSIFVLHTAWPPPRPPQRSRTTAEVPNSLRGPTQISGRCLRNMTSCWLGAFGSVRETAPFARFQGMRARAEHASAHQPASSTHSPCFPTHDPRRARPDGDAAHTARERPPAKPRGGGAQTRAPPTASTESYGSSWPAMAAARLPMSGRTIPGPEKAL